MSIGLFLLGALGGGLGAALRFVVDGAVAQRFGTRFPWGIFIINASGSLLLGLWDDDANLHHLGVASSSSVARRTELREELAPFLCAISRTCSLVMR